MKTILLTGATDGLGRGVAQALAGQGHTLLLHGRDPAKGRALLAELSQVKGVGPLFYYNADFASLADIKALAAQVQTEHPKLEVLINNAGLGVESSRRASRDGLEMVFQVDYLATYLLTRLLLPPLRAAAPARVVSVASAGQAPLDFQDPLLERRWDGVQAYCQAKGAQITLTMALAPEYAKVGVHLTVLHPASYMPTKIVKGRFGVQSPLAEGVAAVVRLATDPQLAGATGQYFDRTRPTRALAQAYDPAAQQQLLELSARLTGV